MKTKIEPLAFPVSVNLDITYRCNAKCSFCYIIDKGNDQKISINENKVKDIIDRLALSGVFRINFFGGEPTLVRQLPELIRYCHEQGLKTTMITNGLCITDQFCEEVSPYLDGMGVSVHGIEEEHNKALNVPNAFNKLLEKLDLLKKHRINFGINYTVIEGSDQSLLTLSEFLIDQYNISFIAANRFVGGRGKDDQLLEPSVITLNKTLEVFEYLENKHPNIALNYAIHFPLCLIHNSDHRKYVSPCGIGGAFCSVNFEGDMRICSYSEEVLGNVLTTPPTKIWLENKILNDYRSGTWVPNECSNCDLFDKCLTGCRITNPDKHFAPDKSLLKLSKIKPIKI